MLYGVNFNLASIKLPAFGTLLSYISNEKHIIFTLENSTFETTELAVFLEKPDNSIKMLTSSATHSCTLDIQKELKENNLDDFQECFFKVTLIGTSSKYTKETSFVISNVSIKKYTIPTVTLLCSDKILCKGSADSYIPPDKPIRIPPTFYATNNAFGSDNIFVMTDTRATLQSDISSEIYKPTFLSIKYKHVGSGKFDIRVIATKKDSQGNEIQVTEAIGYEVPTCWNKTYYKSTEEYDIITVQSADYLDKYDTIKGIELYLRGKPNDTLIIYDFAITEDGYHNFDF